MAMTDGDAAGTFLRVQANASNWKALHDVQHGVRILRLRHPILGFGLMLKLNGAIHMRLVKSSNDHKWVC